eukprot:augustus_masked-scaffold_1-processed-gene-8.56-mRNA-1 protein AED:1.00 eAED:1.00 QI:0/-1/0/0/-1/1/1/0/504
MKKLSRSILQSRRYLSTTASNQNQKRKSLLSPVIKGTVAVAIPTYAVLYYSINHNERRLPFSNYNLQENLPFIPFSHFSNMKALIDEKINKTSSPSDQSLQKLPSEKKIVEQVEKQVEPDPLPEVEEKEPHIFSLSSLDLFDLKSEIYTVEEKAEKLRLLSELQPEVEVEETEVEEEEEESIVEVQPEEEPVDQTKVVEEIKPEKSAPSTVVESQDYSLKKVEMEFDQKLDISANLETILAEDLSVTDPVVLRKRLIHLSLDLQRRSEVEAERLVKALNIQNEKLHETYSTNLERLLLDKELEYKEKLVEQKLEFEGLLNEAKINLSNEVEETKRGLVDMNNRNMSHISKVMEDFKEHQIEQVASAVDNRIEFSFLANVFRKRIIPLIINEKKKEEVKVVSKEEPVAVKDETMVQSLTGKMVQLLRFQSEKPVEKVQEIGPKDSALSKVAGLIEQGNFSKAAFEIKDMNTSSKEVVEFIQVLESFISQREELKSIFEEWRSFSA